MHANAIFSYCVNFTKTYYILGDKVNFKIINDNSFIVKVNCDYIKFNDEDIYEQIKRILINIRKRYAYDIYGFYDVEISYIEKFITILKFIKKDEDEIFRNTIDLKISKDNKSINLKFNDYFLISNYLVSINNNKYEIDSKLIKDKDILKLCEHYTI